MAIPSYLPLDLAQAACDRFNLLEERAGKWQQLAEEMIGSLRKRVESGPGTIVDLLGEDIRTFLAKYDLLREEKA